MLERDGERIITEKRCMQGRLSEQWDHGHVVRMLDDSARCFDFATDSFLGFVRTAESRAFRLASEDETSDVKVAIYQSVSPSAELISVAIDSTLRMPLWAEFRSGETWSWEYPESVQAAQTPPPPGLPPDVPTEVYTDLEPNQAATALGLATIPDSLAGLPLDAVFSYEPADGPRSTYAIWRAEDGREVQLVITDHPPQPDELGIEDFGGTVVLRLEERNALVQVSAPDRSMLKQAVAILRPKSGLPVVDP